MIKAEDIIKSYGNGESRFQVLKGISLDIEDNDFVVILGAKACPSTACVIRSQLWPSSRGWTSRRCPTSWATTARASPWTPTPTSPGICGRRLRTGWAASWPRISENI